MTNLPEARLAREAEICYATIAFATDYDCWHQEAEDVSIAEVLRILSQSAKTAKNAIRTAVGKLPEERKCICATALKNALITGKKYIPEKTKKDLEPIIGKYLSLLKKVSFYPIGQGNDRGNEVSCRSNVGEAGQEIADPRLRCSLLSRDRTHELVHLAQQEERVILTRNTKFFPGAPSNRIFRVTEDKSLLQVQELLRKGLISPEEKKLFSKCLVCNATLNEIPRDEADGKVPEFIFTSRRNSFGVRSAKESIGRGPIIKK